MPRAARRRRPGSPPPASRSSPSRTTRRPSSRSASSVRPSSSPTSALRDERGQEPLPGRSPAPARARACRFSRSAPALARRRRRWRPGPATSSSVPSTGAWRPGVPSSSSVSPRRRASWAGCGRRTTRLRKAAEDERREALWRGHFDALTGLPDGERLERTLESALVGASEKSQVAVALFDIEHLVMLNTRLGRARANSVLQQVAQRLIAVLRSEEMRRSGAGPSMSMAARLGGGLFAVMLTGLPGGAEAKASRPPAARPSVRPLLRRGRGDRPLHERRHRPRPRRRADRRVPAPEGGAGGPRGAGERGRDPLLRAVVPPHDGAEPGHHAPAPQRARPRRAPAPLPAAGRRIRVARPRRRGAPPLGVPRARRGPAVGVRPPRRGGGPDGGDRELGPADGLPAGRVVAAAGASRLPGRGERVALPARARRPRAGRAGVPRRDRHRRRAAGARAERARRAAQRPRDPAPAQLHPGPRRAGWRSTTSAPGTRPSPTSSSSRSTC